MKNSNFLLGYKQILREIVFPIKKQIQDIVKTVHNLPQIININQVNQQLEKENSQLKYEILQLKQQNCNFKSNRGKGNNSKIARVLGYEQEIFSSALLTETVEDISIGYVVSSTDGFVGLVTAIAGDVAFVTTVTDKRIAVPVKNKKNQHLILKGQNKNSMIAVAFRQQDDDLGNINEIVKVGDILYTSGEGGILKSNIPVAKVISVNQNVIAQPIVRLDNLEYVYLTAPVLKHETIAAK